MKNGPFTSRAQLLKVPRLGDKAYEQAAGFLRIRQAANPLDRSAVHPERYELVEKMAKDLGVAVRELMLSEELRQRINLKNYLSEAVGIPTLQDILEELAKPGRDPREQFEVFEFEKRCQCHLGSQNRHEASGSGHQHHRLWCICRCRGASGWIGALESFGRSFCERSQ